MIVSELSVVAPWAPRVRNVESPRRHQDAALVERLQRGEDAAVGEAYDRHHVAVRRFARRLVGDEAAAEDLVQEVFLTCRGP
jgi:hypothetical protein